MSKTAEMRTIEQMVQQEVMCCMSSLVSTLAQGNHGITEHPSRGPDMPLRVLSEQAFELSSPIPDYEEAAIQKGWEPYKDKYEVNCWRDDAGTTFAGTAEQLCAFHDIEPYDDEVFEHWAVTQWLANKLAAAGEKVDNDFGGLCVWARTTTGQAISADGVIEKIYKEMMTG